MPRIFITSGTTYTLPADFNPANNLIECYGSGAGGTNVNGSAGGGGGAYAASVNVNVAANTTVQISVGTPALSNTWFNATSLANAVTKGPTLACGAQGASYATGGAAGSSCGTTTYSGGNGGAAGSGGAILGGGGGGGAAGPYGAGGNGAGNQSLSGYGVGGGGGGADGGYSTSGWNGGANRLGAGAGTGGLSAAPGTAGGGGGGAQYATGAGGGFEDVYSTGVYGPSGGAGGGGSRYGSGAGGTSNGYGGGGGGSGDGAVGGTGAPGLIVITYTSVAVGGPTGVPSSFLPLRAPYFAPTQTLRPPDVPSPPIGWLKQPPDLIEPQAVKFILKTYTTPPLPAPNPTPLYKPPWLLWPDLLRHPPAALDFRQQFPGLKPLDFFAHLNEGPDTVSAGSVYVHSSINAALIESDLCTSTVHPIPDLGGSDDILRRVKLLIPKGWFARKAPIRDAILGGLSDLSAWCYSLVAYAKDQTRVAWATGIWLDIISKDYFGFNLLRRVNESDATFRARIQEELIRERVTRAGMSKALSDLTGKTPYIFEPWNPGDCGAWDIGTFAWDVGVCGWGDTCLPGQAFVNVVPPGAGIPSAPGWDIASGWDSPGTMWGDMDMIAGTITNADIYATINKTRPTGVIVWTQLFPPAAPIPIPPAPVLTPSFAPPVMNPLVVQPPGQMYSIAATSIDSIGLL